MAPSKRMQLGFCAVAASLLFLAKCGVNNVADGGTETGNARVIGMLYEPDGKTPAIGVRVVIRPKKSLADTSGTGLPKRLAAVDSVTTDSAGRFAFDSTLDTGTYVIEAASGNDAVLIDSVAVTSQDSTDSLPPDTLKPAGALRGVIKLSEGGDPRKVFILAFGIDRFARVEADGRFRFQNLAEAAYSLRIISSLDDYGVLDTVGVPVRSADTTNLDTIELPFTGIPTPRGLTISYDTLRQIVTLIWRKADTTLVNGYNVYRRNVDSNTVLERINPSLVTDTVYVDSTVKQGFTYEYQLKAVDKSANEGLFSVAVQAAIVSAFTLVDSLSFIGNITDFVLSGDSILLLDSTTKMISAYDTALRQTTKDISLGFMSSSPKTLKRGSDGTFFCLPDSPQVLYHLNGNGDTLKSWQIDSAYVNDFCFFNDSLYLLYHSFPDRFYNHIGKTFGSFAIASDSIAMNVIDSADFGYYKGILVTQERIYLAFDDYSKGYGFDIFNRQTGAKQEIILDPVEGAQTQYYQMILSNQMLYFLYSRNYLYGANNHVQEKVFIVDPAGSIITTITIPKEREILRIQIGDEGSVYCLTTDQKILVFRR